MAVFSDAIAVFRALPASPLFMFFGNHRVAQPTELNERFFHFDFFQAELFILVMQLLNEGF
jgi:hypothetical protein